MNTNHFGMKIMCKKHIFPDMIVFIFFSGTVAWEAIGMICDVKVI